MNTDTVLELIDGALRDSTVPGGDAMRWSPTPVVDDLPNLHPVVVWFRDLFREIGRVLERAVPVASFEPLLLPPVPGVRVPTLVVGSFWAPPGGGTAVPSLGGVRVDAAALDRYQAAVAAGLSEYEAREEGWPTR